MKAWSCQTLSFFALATRWFTRKWPHSLLTFYLCGFLAVLRSRTVQCAFDGWRDGSTIPKLHYRTNLFIFNSLLMSGIAHYRMCVPLVMAQSLRSSYEPSERLTAPATNEGSFQGKLATISIASARSMPFSIPTQTALEGLPQSHLRYGPSARLRKINRGGLADIVAEILRE
jgi:hypothetical protein